jgi:translocator protein
MARSSKYIKLGKSIVSLIICLAAGWIGSFFTSASVDTWYQNLNKPWFNPPDRLFAPVWTFLYILMGISLSVVWSSPAVSQKKKTALAIFSIQLLLNIMWSAFFFGLQNPLLALAEIFLLWLAVIITILSFRRISQISAYLLTPYLLWVTFALILNYSIVTMN